jgi:hypothetical protein
MIDRSLRSLRGGALAACLLLFGPAALCAELVVNGGFETNGGANTNTFSGWTVTDQAGGSGSFFAQTGTSNPTGFSCSGTTVPAPPQGTFAAMTTQNGPGSHLLSQDVTVPAATTALFTARFFVNNQGSAFVTPASLDYTAAPNQQFRIDVMTTASALTDMGAGILAGVYRTNTGDPLISGYNVISFDMSAFAGQTVRLRIAEVDTQGCISTGIDAVSVQAPAPTAVAPVPTLSQYMLPALAALLLVLGFAAARRRG